MTFTRAAAGMLLATGAAVAWADGQAEPARPVVVQAAPAPATEVHHYRWELTKLAGVFGGLFLPSSGEGTLSVSPEPDGKFVRSELLVTAKDSRNGEFWRYGAVLDPVLGKTIRAWSSYRYRDKSKVKKEELDRDGVFDIASAIYRLRRDRPTTPLRLLVWSDGKTYPVIVTPGAVEKWTLPSGVHVNARRYLVRGVTTAGKEPWRGSFDLWLADDAAATPVRIEIGRSYAGVRLDLVR